MSNNYTNGLNGYGYNTNGYYNNNPYHANPNNNPSVGYPAGTQAHSSYTTNANTPSYAYDTYSTVGNPVNNANVQYPVDAYSSYHSNVSQGNAQPSYVAGVHYTNYPNYTSNVQSPGHINPPNHGTAAGYTPSTSTSNPQAAPYVYTPTAQTGAQKSLLSDHPLFAQSSAQPTNVYSPPTLPQQQATAITEPSRLLSEHWAFTQPSFSALIAGQKPLLSEHPVFAQPSVAASPADQAILVSAHQVFTQQSVQQTSPNNVNNPTAASSMQQDVYSRRPNQAKERKPRGMIGQTVDAGRKTPPNRYLETKTASESVESAESKALHDSFVAEQMQAAASMSEEKTKKEGKTVNGKTVNGKTVNGKTVNGKTVNGKTVNGKTVNGKTVNGKTVNGKTVKGKAGVKEETATKPQTKEPAPSKKLTSQKEFQAVQDAPIAKPNMAEMERKALVAKTRRLVAIELDAKETGPITSIRRSRLDDEIWKETHARMARLDAGQEKVKTPVAGTMGYTALTPRIEASERPDWVNHLGLALPGMKRKVPVVTPPSSSDLDRLSPPEQIAGGKRKRTVDGDETPSKKAKMAPAAEVTKDDHAVLEAATPPVSTTPPPPPAPAAALFATTGEPAASAEKKRKRGDDDDDAVEEPAKRATKLNEPEHSAEKEQASPSHCPLLSTPPAASASVGIPPFTATPTAENTDDDDRELEAALLAELSKPSSLSDDHPPTRAGVSATASGTRKRRARGGGRGSSTELLRQAVRRDREVKDERPKVLPKGPKQKRPGLRVGEKPTGVGKKR
ncbi:hypothetical protein LTR35_009638 [Friedmanniomyces endolithicus]|nr:hypothetical protein LTR35_009638 [Friedmanniomyces endolithicus]KAK0983872.1 hypothetical protein LTR54_014164 [Friedmanniomyces endolithicus]